MVHLLFKPDPIDSTGGHDSRCNLAQVVAEVDLVPTGITRKRLIQQMQGFNTTSKRL